MTKKKDDNPAQTAGDRVLEALGGSTLTDRVKVLEHVVLTRLNVDLVQVAEELGVRADED